MRSKIAALLALSVALGPHCAVAEESQADDLGVLLSGGKAALSFRYRFEAVDDDGFARDAEASTIRSRFGFQSGRYRDWSFFVEVDDIRELFFDDFNVGGDATPGRTEFPNVDDPEGTDLNQAYVDYDGIDGVKFRFGRQRINFDNQRFVGGVGWRQNEQTYDGIQVRYGNETLTGSVTWVDNVNRIFGDDVKAGDHVQDGTFLVNIAGNVGTLGKLTGYYYHIDNEDASAASSATFGARLTGKASAGGFGIRYAAEYATQDDVGANVSYAADYYALDVGAVFERVDVGVGWEVLEGDADAPGRQFRTPLATLHAFNGWADKFIVGGLGNRNEGIDDRYVKVNVTPNENVVVNLRYHRFEAEDGGTDFGSEFNAQVGYRFNKRLRGDLFYADFDADGDAPAGLDDTQKFWIMVTASI